MNQTSHHNSMFQDIGRETTQKLATRNCLKYLETTLIIGTGGWSQNLSEVLSKKIMKNKRGFGKIWHFFCLFVCLFLLKLILLNFWGIANVFITNYVPPWWLWPSKNWGVKNNDRYNEFLLFKKNILSIQSALRFFFLHATLHKHKKFLYFLLNILLQL